MKRRFLALVIAALVCNLFFDVCVASVQSRQRELTGADDDCRPRRTNAEPYFNTRMGETRRPLADAFQFQYQDC